VNEYKIEKDKLTKAFSETHDEKAIYCERLENEIQSYKNMTENCVKTCSQLAEELMFLRKEIEKYTNSHPSPSYSNISTAVNNFPSNNNSSKKVEIKTLKGLSSIKKVKVK
jgi:archaellum component FlaC